MSAGDKVHVIKLINGLQLFIAGGGASVENQRDYAHNPLQSKY